MDLEDVGEVGGVVGADVVAGDHFGEGGGVAGGDEEGVVAILLLEVFGKSGDRLELALTLLFKGEYLPLVYQLREEQTCASCN